ncbi:MAG TPA: YfiR family protein [Candidatus Omnitrophota bacterium]|nr:YfiR family protein [Candidatus Omnitrophota bacterium]
MHFRAAVVLLISIWIFSLFTLCSYAIEADQIKVAFIYNFSKYIDWPTSVPGDTFTVCGYGDGDDVLSSISGKSTQGKTIKIKKLSNPEEADSCHIVYIRSGVSAEGILANLKNKHVLTVGDESGFLNKGGMIGFKMNDGKVLFDINATLVRGNGLTVSSQLLKFANEIK